MSLPFVIILLNPYSRITGSSHVDYFYSAFLLLKFHFVKSSKELSAEHEKQKQNIHCPCFWVSAIGFSRSTGRVPNLL